MAKLVLSELGYSAGPLWFWEDDIEKFIVDTSNIDLIAEWLKPQLLFLDTQLIFDIEEQLETGQNGDLDGRI